MEILKLAATQFIKPMLTGRNRPLLLGCEDTAGQMFESVVKLRGREMSEKTQIAELVCAMLADDLGIDVPQAAVVDVPAGFELIVADKDAARAVKASVGPNFGSIHLGQSFTTWPPARTPHGHHRDQAAAIFAFDALIQNPDRTAKNPNLWVRSDRLGVYDHDQAFSFLSLPIIGGAPRPWDTAAQASGSFRFLEQHIFFAPLRGSAFDLDGFEERLGDLGETQFSAYADNVPADWREGNGLCEDIVAYLSEARGECSTFVKFMKHLLR
jgi:hypothetical protein